MVPGNSSAGAPNTTTTTITSAASLSQQAANLVHPADLRQIDLAAMLGQAPMLANHQQAPATSPLQTSFSPTSALATQEAGEGAQQQQQLQAMLAARQLASFQSLMLQLSPLLAAQQQQQLLAQRLAAALVGNLNGKTGSAASAQASPPSSLAGPGAPGPASQLAAPHLAAAAAAAAAASLPQALHHLNPLVAGLSLQQQYQQQLQRHHHHHHQHGQQPQLNETK